MRMNKELVEGSGKASKYVTRAALVAVVVVATVQVATAATVSSQLFLGELNLLSDNSGEAQNFDGNDDGYLGLGDTLRGTLEIETVEDLTGGGSTNFLGGVTPNDELTAVFEIQVRTLTIVADPDGSCGTDPNCGGGGLLSGDEIAEYTFGPYAPFAAEFGVGAGTMAAFFEDTTPDYDRTLGTIAAIEATATDGALALELGFFGDADEIWLATNAAVDPSLGALIPPGTAIATFNMQVSAGFNNLLPIRQTNAGLALGDGLIDVNGSGGVTGTLGITTAYDVLDNVDLVINFFIPLPAAAWSGIVLLGSLGVTGLIKRRYGAA